MSLRVTWLGTIDSALDVTTSYGKDESRNISGIYVVCLMFQLVKPDTDAEEVENI